MRTLTPKKVGGPGPPWLPPPPPPGFQRLWIVPASHNTASSLIHHLFPLPCSEHQPCDLTTCPSLWCDPSLQYTPKGECCPVCTPPPIAVFSPNLAGCTEQDGTHYNAGETWKRDACVTCTCEDGIPLCSSESCVLPDCNNPIRLPGHCCPVCPLVALAPPPMVVIYPAPRSNECHEGGKIYKDRESWFPDKNDLCKRGYCDEGEIFYFSRQCAAPECENPIYSVDACCPTCPGE